MGVAPTPDERPAAIPDAMQILKTLASLNIIPTPLVVPTIGHIQELDQRKNCRDFRQMTVLQNCLLSNFPTALRRNIYKMSQVFCFAIRARHLGFERDDKVIINTSLMHSALPTGLSTEQGYRVGCSCNELVACNRVLDTLPGGFPKHLTRIRQTEARRRAWVTRPFNRR